MAESTDPEYGRRLTQCGDACANYYPRESGNWYECMWACGDYSSAPHQAAATVAAKLTPGAPSVQRGVQKSSSAPLVFAALGLVVVFWAYRS